MLTTDAITDRLRRAADAVDQAGLPEDLRRVGFERALDALGLGATNIGVPAALTGPTAAAGPLSSHGPDTSPNAQPPDDLLSEIARRLEVAPENIERIYDIDDGQVRLAIKRSMLPDADRKAAGTRHVSLLVAVGRQAAGTEEETAFAVMRDECQAFGVLDSANFSAEVGKLDFRVKGGRNSRTAKANRHHFEEAAQLIGRILRESES
jgi:hypothetical protein